MPRYLFCAHCLFQFRRAPAANYFPLIRNAICKNCWRILCRGRSHPPRVQNVSVFVQLEWGQVLLCWPPQLAYDLSMPPVWPVKSRRISIRIAQKWFHFKNERFWQLKKSLNCGRFGKNNCCHRLLKVAQSAIYRPIWSHYMPLQKLQQIIKMVFEDDEWWWEERENFFFFSCFDYLHNPLKGTLLNERGSY